MLSSTPAVCSMLPRFDILSPFLFSPGLLAVTITDSPDSAVSLASEHFRSLRVLLSQPRNARLVVSRSIDDDDTVDNCLGSRAACLLSRGITYPSVDTLRQHLFAGFTGTTAATIALPGQIGPWKNNRRNDSCHIHRRADPGLANRDTPLFLSAPLCVVPDSSLYTL